MAAAKLASGERIYLYSHRYTNQVVYSLHHVLKPDVLEQLSYVGKKSVDATLRKDMWKPFATVQFQTASLGLDTYHRLRQHRLHRDFNWREFRPELLRRSRKARKMALMNQKAGSVADLAAALAWQKDNMERQSDRYESKQEHFVEAERRLYEQALADLRQMQAHAQDQQAMDTAEQEVVDLQSQLATAAEDEQRQTLQKQLTQATDRLNLYKKLKKATEEGLQTRAHRLAGGLQRHKVHLNALRTGVSHEAYLERRNPRPVRLEGIRILWAQAADKDLASEWPQWVEHGEMDRVRHVASPRVQQSGASWQEASIRIHGPPEKYQVAKPALEEGADGTLLEPSGPTGPGKYPIPEKPETDAATSKPREPMWKRLWPFNRQSAQDSSRSSRL